MALDLLHVSWLVSQRDAREDPDKRSINVAGFTYDAIKYRNYSKSWSILRCLDEGNLNG